MIKIKQLLILFLIALFISFFFIPIENSLPSKKSISWDDNLSLHENRFPAVSRDLSREPLMEKREDSLNKYWLLDGIEIDRSLDVVEELISKKPNVYSYYKTKLILFLTKENSLNLQIDNFAHEDLLLTMSEFYLIDNQTLQKDALLISHFNEEKEKIVSEIEKINYFVEGSIKPEMTAILEYELDIKIREFENLVNNLDIDMLRDPSSYNQEVIDIALYRLLSKKDYTNVIDKANVLLTYYPFSGVGHFFVIEALTLQGKTIEADEYIKSLSLPYENWKRLRNRLQKSKRFEPESYWRELTF